MSQARIVFREVEKSFADQPVLRGVSLSVEPGSVHFVLGKSGAGKSVLIKLLVGLFRADAGSIRFGEHDIGGLDEAGLRQVRGQCQMIFQHATLLEHLSALDNVAMPIAKRKRLAAADAEKLARAALAQVYAEDVADRLPAELGMGVKKRVAIARALALSPDALLYDEPTTSLDPVSARRIDRLMRRLADDLGVTSVVVSHDLRSVRDIADRVTFLHEGKVHFDGSATDFLAAADPVISHFVRSAD